MNSERVLYQGECHGGPFNGEAKLSRFPLGFIAVDKVGRRCWVYQYGDDGFRTEDGENGRDLDDEKRFKTADEPDYDVLAV